MNDQYLTIEGEKRLRIELEQFKGPAREQLARRLRSAIEMGDLSENADYKKAKEDQGFLEGHIQELEYLLRHAIIIEENGERHDVVAVGATVTVQEGESPPDFYHLVGSKEADPSNGRISNQSPIGQALLGKQAGEEVTVRTPAGPLLLKILEIK
ncbi:MAG: transcription elongation factor GreA [Chloroflexi bacterium]|nr:transcription elongation factor GreA [Chloroflexota bacterium]MBU1661668.1 transcription elongation factor GreA [Chloroflexota bacterium]